MAKPIRILLAEDQTTLRQALHRLLEEQEDFQVLVSVDNGAAAVEQAEALQPDIVIIDIEMPEMDGIAATKIIRRRCPQTKVLVLSSHDDIRHLSQALQAGAKGYLLKSTPTDDLLNGIRSIHKGYGQFSPGTLEKVMTRMAVRKALATSANPVVMSQPSTQLPEQIVPAAERQRLLQSFDPERLTQTVQRTMDQMRVEEMLTALNHYLEDQPTNLSALYLSGALARRSPNHQTRAMPFLKLGFREGIRCGLSRDQLLLFYQEGVLLVPEVAFSWLIDAKSPWIDLPGLPFVCQEAIRRFGQASDTARLLLQIYRMRGLETLQGRCQALDPQVKRLQQGFQQLSGVLE